MARVGSGFDMKEIRASRIVWDGEVNITADAAVAAVSGKKKPDDQKKVQAFLREMLKDGKPVAAHEIEKEAKEKGFSKRQLERSKEKLGIETAKEAGKFRGDWWWSIPKPPAS